MYHGCQNKESPSVLTVKPVPAFMYEGNPMGHSGPSEVGRFDLRVFQQKLFDDR